ncbi:LTA synthase family protein [uncultured Polaribacter sp.]|uniref:LTA synthase family protein n=1 Tax=uncultured Polaribacter sp. TaxID=174711 RepID=UPI00262411B1|nr:alkaline phosphatase family protein [uncultured Polaribacter sp.]
MKHFTNRILFNLSYFILWMVYFVFARLFFLLFYFDKVQELGFVTSLKTYLYGFQLDASFAAYLCLIPFLLIIFSIFINPKKVGNLIKWYSYILIIFINLLLIIDASLYQSWGVRLDATLLTYLNTPEVMIASVSNFQMISGIVFWVLSSFLFIKIFKTTINKVVKNVHTGNWLETPIFLFITAALIIPLRGGLQTIPVNQSNVYFSNKMFANHASNNFVWNFFNTLSHNTDTTNPYVFFSDEVAKNTINKRRNKLLAANTDHILNTAKPNVILIIWESLTAKVVGSLGGEPHVTENLNRLSKEGILFTNFYANGDRTDKGIPAILSGYYPQPTKSIMKMPNKTRSLPMLPQKMMDLGYKTSFYHGGDLNFGNMNTYLRNAGITDFVEGSDFDKKDWNSKWGAHDHIFMKRFEKDLKGKQQTPFFKIALTLTSHEPFEILGDYKFGKDTEENKFRSAHAYTDKIIGAFIAFSKKQPWYKNTLIVIMPDHGHSLPKHAETFNSPKKFKIPMLWLGGALHKKGIEVNTISSQVDFPYTLLDLLKGDTSEFTFSKNLFNTSEEQYVHYIFNNGFGTLTKDGIFVYDFTSKKAILEEGSNTAALDSLGKAIIQNAYQDFLDRK